MTVNQCRQRVQLRFCRVFSVPTTIHVTKVPHTIGRWKPGSPLMDLCKTVYFDASVIDLRVSIVVYVIFD